MNLNSHKIRRLNIKSFFRIDIVFGVVNCFLLLGHRASPCTFDHLFVRLPSLCLGVCLLCNRSSKHLCRSLSYSDTHRYVTPGGLLPYLDYIGMCGLKGCGFSAFLVINRVAIVADFGQGYGFVFQP